MLAGLRDGTAIDSIRFYHVIFFAWKGGNIGFAIALLYTRRVPFRGFENIRLKFNGRLAWTTTEIWIDEMLNCCILQMTRCNFTSYIIIDISLLSETAKTDCFSDMTNVDVSPHLHFLSLKILAFSPAVLVMLVAAFVTVSCRLSSSRSFLQSSWQC